MTEHPLMMNYWRLIDSSSYLTPVRPHPLATPIATPTIVTDTVRERLKEVFTDVMDDFHRLHIIKTRFEQWKWGYSNGYQQAFVSMCLPKLFAPYVSLQLIDWNPLQVQVQLVLAQLVRPLLRNN